MVFLSAYIWLLCENILHIFPLIYNNTDAKTLFVNYVFSNYKIKFANIYRYKYYLVINMYK